MPVFAPVAVTLKMHELLRAMLAPESVMPVGLVRVTVPPPQSVALALGTVSPTGRVSVKPTPVRVSGLLAGLVMVNVRPVVAFSAIGFGLKDVAMVGGASTLRPAEAVFPAPPLVDVTFPVVLVNEPAAAPVTVTLKLHVPAARTMPPENVMVDGAVSVTVPPPQSEALAFGTVKPLGRISVKPTPVSAIDALGFVMSKFRDVVVPSGIEVGVKLMASDGGEIAAADRHRTRPLKRASKRQGKRKDRAVARRIEYLPACNYD